MLPTPLVVGFDLDMTLLDTRPGIKATLDALAARTKTYIDSDLAVTRLGPPLGTELAQWFSSADVPEALAIFRELYPTHAVPATIPLPGAIDAVRSVREREGRVLVITGKYEPNAKLHLEHADLQPDVLVGELWAGEKGAALREHGAAVYVGDHLGDIEGARVAGACAVAVATGPYDVKELREAGADTALADLTEFPDWLDTHVRSLAADEDRWAGPVATEGARPSSLAGANSLAETRTL